MTFGALALARSCDSRVMIAHPSTASVRMRHRAAGLSILLLALLSGACNRDAVTGLPPITARSEVKLSANPNVDECTAVWSPVP